MGSRRRQSATMAACVAVVISVAAGCGGSGGSDDDAAKAKKAGTSTTTQAKPDKTEFCRQWSRFQTSTSYHPDLAAYRTFWSGNDKVAKQLVVVAPDAISDDVADLAKGVASMKAAVGRATSVRTWSAEETKLYLKQVRLPEIQVSNYADQACPATS